MDDKINTRHTPDELYTRACNMFCAYESGKLTRSEFIQIIAVSILDSFLYGLYTQKDEPKVD